MFQSSSTASGNWRWHAASASSPSSASEISNSSPSRKRRATLRITLESSTTRQVFIALRPLLNGRAHPTRSYRQFLHRSGSHGLVAALEDAFHVEHHEQLLVQPMHPRRHARQMGIEIDRIRLAAAFGELEHLADGIDQQAVGFAAILDADRHAARSIWRWP